MKNEPGGFLLNLNNSNTASKKGLSLPAKNALYICIPFLSC